MSVVGGIELGRALGQTMAQINTQIEEVKKTAKVLDVQSSELRDMNGNFVMVPLLAAKAQTLHALVLINQRRN